MGRSRAAKRGVKAPIPIPPPVPTPAAPEPEPEEELTPHELLIEAAALIASCDYEAAKDACAKAVEGAIAEGDGTVTRDAYEILGTIELELGELDEAREVRIFFPPAWSAGGRGGRKPCKGLMGKM